MENLKTNRIYHAAVYVRLSKEDSTPDGGTIKEESDSIVNQKELIRAFLADKTDIEICAEYADDGYSGVNFERPNFRRMIREIEAGHIDCVVVKDLSRLGRNFVEAGRYIDHIFPALGVRFIAVNDGFDSVNGRTSSDRILIPFKNLINDAYCRDISVKIRSQLETKRRKGDFIGSFAVYGYMKDQDDRHKLVVDEYAAEVVKAM
ncbi:MAG: recombinase family protein, partial [Acetatifactor sp.]|nr:recombinase family protein [Acetatifactor sp.]